VEGMYDVYVVFVKCNYGCVVCSVQRYRSVWCVLLNCSLRHARLLINFQILNHCNVK
jgi:hypothetical protein